MSARRLARPRQRATNGPRRLVSADRLPVVRQQLLVSVDRRRLHRRALHRRVPPAQEGRMVHATTSLHRRRLAHGHVALPLLLLHVDEWRRRAGRRHPRVRATQTLHDAHARRDGHRHSHHTRCAIRRHHRLQRVDEREDTRDRLQAQAPPDGGWRRQDVLYRGVRRRGRRPGELPTRAGLPAFVPSLLLQFPAASTHRRSLRVERLDPAQFPAAHDAHAAHHIERVPRAQYAQSRAARLRHALLP